MAVQIINGIMAVFFVIGALDYLLDNKLGLGSEFERGFGCAEKLFITMGGFVALAPVIARVLSPVVCPFFRRWVRIRPCLPASSPAWMQAAIRWP